MGNIVGDEEMPDVPHPNARGQNVASTTVVSLES